MEQIILRVKLPSGIICFISNTNSDFIITFEDKIVSIGVLEQDIYNDTKRQLARTRLVSLKQLEDCLNKETAKDSRSPDAIGLSQMLKAIREIISERESDP